MYSGETIKVLLKIIKQNLPLIKAWKWLFLLVKPKWCLDIKLEAFHQFSRNGNRKQLVLFYLESLLLISGISGFSFFVIEHIRKPETTENFQKLIFWGIKANYLISSTLLSILCVQDKTLKVLLKVTKEYLLLKLEIDFSYY